MVFLYLICSSHDYSVRDVFLGFETSLSVWLSIYSNRPCVSDENTCWEMDCYLNDFSVLSWYSFTLLKITSVFIFQYFANDLGPT